MRSQLIKKGDKEYWTTIIALFIGSFATFALFYCFQPLIPVFSSSYSISPATASLSVSTTAASLAAALLITPSLSDKFGRKTIMSASLIGSSCLVCCTIFIDDFVKILAIRILQGIFLAGYPAIAMAYIQEEFDPSIAGIVMGIFVGGNSIGGLSGRIIVSTLSDFFSWHVAIGVLSFLCLLISIWFYKYLPESQNFYKKTVTMHLVIRQFIANIKTKILFCFYIIGFLAMGAFIALYNYIAYPLAAPPYSLSQTFIGFIFLIYLVGTFSSTFVGRLSYSHGLFKMLSMSLSLMLIGTLITLFSPLWIKISGIAVFTFGFFGSHSILSNAVVKFSSNSKAQSSALYLLFYYAGSSVIGAWGGSFLIWKDWIGVVILLSSAITLALILSCILLLKNK